MYELDMSDRQIQVEQTGLIRDRANATRELTTNWRQSTELGGALLWVR